MDKPYFIMMYNQQGTIAMPITGNDDEDNDDDDVMFFATEDDARKLAMEHTYCQAFGYEIFCMGEGEI